MSRIGLMSGVISHRAATACMAWATATSNPPVPYEYLDMFWDLKGATVSPL